MNIFKNLAQYNPLLAGTIPLDIDTATSDLDIICQCTNHQEFSDTVKKYYGHLRLFKIKRKKIDAISTTIAKFEGQKFTIEIFAQNIPSEKQNAFRHLLIEHCILKKQGDVFKQQVMALKKNGIKTEPAFAYLLGLTGDPYSALLKVNCKE